ncbi:acyltransferase domain-containing protein [Thermocatellispora tengchongensis]|uniref:acyltransferase domain-containing protein n=1 Tax=Thermocatellispora tengchongensis TaxID=1073253 RepID=UPI00362FB04C
MDGRRGDRPQPEQGPAGPHHPRRRRRVVRRRGPHPARSGPHPGRGRADAGPVRRRRDARPGRPRRRGPGPAERSGRSRPAVHGLGRGPGRRSGHVAPAARRSVPGRTRPGADGSRAHPRGRRPGAHVGGRGRAEPGVHRPRVRLADRRRAAQPAERRDRAAVARHAGVRLPDGRGPGRSSGLRAARRPEPGRDPARAHRRPDRARRTDRDRGDGLPVPRRRPRPGIVVGTAVRRGRRDHRAAPGPGLGHSRHVPPGPRHRRHLLRPQRRIRARRRRVRSGLLRDQSPRGTGHGPAAAAAAGDLVGGAGTGRDRPDEPAGLADRGLRRRLGPGIRTVRLDRLRRPPADRGLDQRAVRARLLHPGAGGPGGHRGHGLFLLAGGAASGRAGAAGGECSLALAGGVTIMATPGALVGFSRQRGLAQDGRCKAFSAHADGIGMAEGAGMMLLERLSDARRNGHPVLAVIRGSAVNQDGASNGLTAPNGPSQQRVIRAALANARLSAAEVDAVEAHGTGTTLGDPIEAQALLATYGQDRPEDRPLWLGSVKSNLGHTQSAAGAAGVMKMVLALRHQELPRTLHAEEPAENIDWSAGNVELLAKPRPWPVNGRVRRAGVSAFGISGTNAHVIIEEAPAAGDPPSTAGDPEPAVPVLTGPVAAWLVSARSGAGLRAQAGRLGEFVRARPELDVADVAWSLVTSRSVFEHRAVVVGRDRPELLSGLSSVAAGRPAAGVVTGTVPAGGGGGRVVFVFPGQGSQWAGMGRELAEASPVFAARLAECGRALAPYVDWSLDDVLHGREGAPGLDRVDVVQPALWAVMVSLASVWQAAGVEPDAVVGHSQGEIAAAVVAGILTLEDAAKIVALRSQALTALSGRGGMLSIAESADAVAARVAHWDGRASVAAVNGPDATVVSGDPDALAEVLAGCERDGVRARMLPVDYASHGPQADELREEILRLLDGVVPGPARVPIVSAMTGEFLRGPEMDAGYWYASLRAPVEFSRAIEALGRAGYGVFVETSAHPVLVTAIGATLENARPGDDPAEPGTARGLRRPPVLTGTLRRDDGGADRMLASLAEVHVHGVPVDWAAVLPTGARVDLPTYAFQHQRFWLETGKALRSGDPAEARFWAAVEDGDLAGLTGTLAVDPDKPFREVLPALASWRQRERGETVTAGWRYRISWPALPDPRPAPLTGTWLLVAAPAQRELAGACMSALDAAGADVVLVETAPGETGRQALADRLDPGPAPAGVVSLLALDEAPLPGAPVVTTGLAGTLALLQALGDRGIEAPLWVLTRGAVAAGPGETLASPGQSPVWGLGRVAALEHPGRWGGLIDLPSELDERAADRLVRLLAAGDTLSGEDQVAIRGDGIRVRRLVRAPRTGGAERWTPTGTVLVTGGTGAVGGRVGGWLAGRGAPGSSCPAAPGRPPPVPPRSPPRWPKPAPPSRWSPATPPTGSRPPPCSTGSIGPGRR